MTVVTTQKASPIWHPFTQAKTAAPPLMVRRGSGVTLELADGRQLIDCISSWWVNIHGHSQPDIAKAIYEQATALEHVIFAGFTHEPAEALASGLLKHLPATLNHVFFSDNGSTAVEIALKMAYQYWQNKGVSGRQKFIAFDQAYHGDTVGAMSIGKTMPYFKRFQSLLFEIETVPFADTWDGDQDREEKEEAALSHIQKIIEANINDYAGAIIEPLIQGAGGMRMCSTHFLQSLEALLKSAQLPMIYDEVFTGFGRTGDWFACKKTNTTPDIICLSKGITGGFLPLAVTVATENIYQSFYSDSLENALLHGHSYTGNPLACAAANASLRLLEDNPSSFTQMEVLHRLYIEKWLAGNKRLEKFRVCGTIAAFDVVNEEGTGYFNSLGVILRQQFMERGFLIRPMGNTIYLATPYCITAEELESAYRVIAEVVTHL